MVIVSEQEEGIEDAAVAVKVRARRLHLCPHAQKAGITCTDAASVSTAVFLCHSRTERPARANNHAAQAAPLSALCGGVERGSVQNRRMRAEPGLPGIEGAAHTSPEKTRLQPGQWPHLVAAESIAPPWV